MHCLRIALIHQLKIQANRTRDSAALSEDELIALAGDASQSRNSEDIEQFNRQVENACTQSMREEMVSS